MSIHIYHFIYREAQNWLKDIGVTPIANGPFLFITVDRIFDGGIAAFLMSMDTETMAHPSFPFLSTMILDFVESRKVKQNG